MDDERASESPISAVLYRRLLGLQTHTDVGPLLDDIVRLIVELTKAQLAIVELLDQNLQPAFWRGYGRADAELDVLRASISRGIVAHTLKEGRTVLTTSALADPRFAELDSVRQRAIEAVLCSPIGSQGVVYLQGRIEAGPFDDHDRELVELTARQVAQVAPRVIERRHLLDTLERHKWNIAKAARELHVSRQHLYDLIRRLQLRADAG